MNAELKEVSGDSPLTSGLEGSPAISRLESIDLMRGLVMVLMALDHTRDFFSNAMIDYNQLSQTSIALFITRWITHICAPTFVFLAGAGAYLSTRRRNLTDDQLSRYLFTRGLLLIVLELTLVRFVWTFNWNYDFVLLQVIWVLGWSMVVLAGLIYMPRWVIALFAVTMIAGHNAFDAYRPQDVGMWGWLWSILHVPGSIKFFPGHTLFVAYPLIPWIGVMAAGYCIGPVFLQAKRRREITFLLLGFTCMAAFFFLRLGNVYGDPRPWLPQQDPLFMFFSILSCEKYPPSLLYLLVTMGIMFFILTLFERMGLHRIGRPLIIFGRVPLFFYVIHFFLIHATALAAAWFRGLPTDWLFHGFGLAPFTVLRGPESGYGLATVYGVSIALLLLLYPICHTYAKFKQRHRGTRWLSYL
jgi:uncharacterized membrane protein